MPARQGFIGTNNEPYVYQENNAGFSAALGIDSSGVYSLSVSGVPGTTPNPTSQLVIDPLGNSTLRSSTKVVADGFLQVTSLTAGFLQSDASGNITIGSPTSMTWAVTTVNATMAVDHGYIANKAGLLTMTLPATSVIGSIITITGINNATGWAIAQSAGQTIYFGTGATTTGVGGSLASSATRDSITMVCVVADLSWNVLSSIGNVTIV